MKRKLLKLMMSLSLALMVFHSFAQDITIKGKVTDDSGSPIYGVNVGVKGSTRGTITDNNGDYSIAAAKGSTLAFSYIGFG
ncbi:MAG: hypothetical protein EAZ22_17260 [Cytophagales bacterium]|nr:MAG: hypothetical protein EAZ38_19280 [Cytophagales bacterium]TAG76734.1 MAG: hypothetical protein EAZ22_17260 [Cytophagales bacterium]